MPEYLTPDVYVEEVPAGPRPIQAVGTRTAAFVGVAPRADQRRGEAVAINNWAQFMRTFVSIEGRPNPSSTPLSHAVFGFFQNGGGRCFVVNIPRNAGVVDGLAALKAQDEVAIVAAPGYADQVSYGALLDHAEEMLDRVAILDGPLTIDDLETLTRPGEAVAPRQRGARAGDTPDQKPGQRARPSDGGYGAFYFPGIRTRDALSGELVDVHPSGHIAGIWARSDATRGVHKAPANEVVRGALNVTYRLTREEQGSLNPYGVNCIRFFPREGIRVWGARTLADAASEWRYLNVRRLFNMVEESIAEATRWIVFEPNDEKLWKAIRRDVGAFLTRVWRDGALMGRTPEEAFFVKCDAETNPPEVIDAGMVVAICGLAPVKPAEFVIFRISQYAGGVEIAAEGGSGG
jgi:phage tail sheath protein FI